MDDIFISYKREDRDRVEPFATALEREGFSVWWDPELPIGHSYSSSIRRQLSEARAVIPVWTHLSVHSEWVQEEATVGKRRGILFPIRLDTVDPPIGFTMVETADLSDWHPDARDHPEWSRLLGQLRAMLRGEAASTAKADAAVEAPPTRIRRRDENRMRFLAAGGIIVAIAAVGFALQRGCGEAPLERLPEPAGPVSTAAGTVAPRDVSSPPAPRDVSTPPAPRDVSAPPVAAGSHSTIVDARQLDLGVAEPGEILTTEDTRFYKIDYVRKIRDLAIVRLQNESTTLRPNVKIFNADRSQIAEAYDGEKGASIQRSVPLNPGQMIYVQVLPYSTTGKYKISVTPQNAYDAFETNDDVLRPAAVKMGMDINAGIMDDKDNDWYRFSGASTTKVTVTFENLSTTLRPHLKVYDANKSQVMEKSDGTAGANVNFDVEFKQARDFYVEVLPFGTAGKYRLRLD